MATTYAVPGVYSTITLAIAAIPTDLSGTGIHEIVIDKGLYIEDCVISGFTNASSSDRITVRAKTGDEHKGIYGAGVVIQGVAAITTVASLISYSTFLNLEVNDGLTHSFETGMGAFTNGISNNTIKNCLVQNREHSAFSFQATSASGNILINCAANKTCEVGFQSFSSGSIDTAYNCTFDTSIKGTRNASGSGTLHVVNTVCIAPICFDSGPHTGSNNVSTDSTAVGANSLINQTVNDMKFSNYAGSDYLLSAADSILSGVGLDLSGTFTEDVQGQTIPTDDWPAGFDFFVSSGGSAQLAQGSKTSIKIGISI